MLTTEAAPPWGGEAAEETDLAGSGITSDLNPKHPKMQVGDCLAAYVVDAHLRVVEARYG